MKGIAVFYLILIVLGLSYLAVLTYGLGPIHAR